MLTLSLRRGSNRESRHDHVLEKLHMESHNTREFGQCNIGVKKYLQMLIELGVLMSAGDTE